LVRLADETVTAAPLAIKLPLSAKCDPTVTFPKLSVVGDTANWPAAVPVPERLMPRGVFEAFDTTERLPLAAPTLAGANLVVKVTLWPAVRVSGSVSPLVENTAPVKLACEIVTVDPPVLVRVSDKLVLLPTWTLPNARLAGFAVNFPGATPVPESGIARLGFEPFEVTFILPLAAPLAIGEKATVNEVLWPALSVKGNVKPLRLNPLPLAVAAEIVRLVPPELVSVPVKDFEVPTWMLPKLKLDGFDTTCPVATPIPESGTESVGLLALDVMTRVPLAAPVADGVKIALNVVLCPPLSVTGRLGPVKLNPLPLAVALETVTVLPPVFVTVTGTVCLVPTVTLPKFTLPGLAINAPAASPLPESERLSGEFEPSEMMLNPPLAAPALVGANAAWKVTL
jgi:hypothetical protein